MELGERVFYYTPKKGRRKLDPRWRLGTYLGHTDVSVEGYLGVPRRNVRKSRTILRVVAGSRWSKELVQRVMGTPHDLTPVDDGEMDPDEVDASEQQHEAEGEGHAEEGEHDVPDAHAVPRRVRITITDLKKHGFTAGCPRCADLEYGKASPRKNHNEDCRVRLYKKFKEEKNI